MMPLLLLFFVIISGSLFLFVITQRKFEEALPVSIGGIPALMFFLGLLFGLKTAFICVLVICAGLLVASFVLLFVKKGFSSFLSCFFTPGFVLFVLFFLGLIYIHYGRPANGFDEFSHWIDSVREMVILDDFGTAPGAQTLFASYPPGMSLFQYFVQKVCLLVPPNGGFREWLCYPAYQLLAFSFVFPLLKKVTWKTLIPIGVLLGLGYLLVLAFYDYGLTMCYIDPFLGIVAGSGFALVYTWEKGDKLRLATLLVALFLMVTVKDSGLFFAIMVAVAMMIKVISWRKEGGASLLRKHPEAFRSPLVSSALLVGGLSVIAIALPKILWKIHYTGRGVSKAFSQPIDLGIVLNVLLHRDTGWHRQAMDTYAKAFFTAPQSVGSLGITVTYPVIFLVLCLLLVGVYALRKAERGQKGILITAVIATALYSFGLSVVYLFKFGESGSMNLLSMDRYLRVPYLAMLILGILLFIEWYQEYQGKRFIAFLAACVLMVGIIPAGTAFGIVSRSSVAEARQFRAPYDALAEQVHAETGDQPAKVYIISQTDDGWDYYVLRYALKPCVAAGWRVFTEGEIPEGGHLKTPEEWTEELKDYDYVIVYRTDDVFREMYGKCFAGGAEAIQEQRIYKMDKSSGLLV